MNVRETNISCVVSNLFETNKRVNQSSRSIKDSPPYSCSPDFLTSYLSKPAARVTPSAEYWLAK